MLKSVRRLVGAVAVCTLLSCAAGTAARAEGPMHRGDAVPSNALLILNYNEHFSDKATDVLGKLAEGNVYWVYPKVTLHGPRGEVIGNGAGVPFKVFRLDTGIWMIQFPNKGNALALHE